MAGRRQRSLTPRSHLLILQVDTFFFLSAFLAVYLMLEQLNKGPDSALAKLSFIGQAPKIYLLRFIRLTP
jgi:hypothetical protein